MDDETFFEFQKRFSIALEIYNESLKSFIQEKQTFIDAEYEYSKTRPDYKPSYQEDDKIKINPCRVCGQDISDIEIKDNTLTCKGCGTSITNPDEFMDVINIWNKGNPLITPYEIIQDIIKRAEMNAFLSNDTLSLIQNEGNNDNKV
ncbi:MAG: hypothetical protein ABSG94_12105 [Brevinematales bacterium]|jgi:hypothetical protein